MGYQNVDTRSKLQYIVPTFRSVTVGDTIKIADIKVTGYEDITAYAEGWNGPIVTKIDNRGYTMNDEDLFGEDTLDLMYIYDDPGDGMVGHWFDNIAFDYIENYPEEAKYAIIYGEGLWVDMPVPQYGEEIKFVYSGEVATDDSQFNLRDKLNIVGNPMPVNVNFADVDVTGYEDIPAYAEGWNGPTTIP